MKTQKPTTEAADPTATNHSHNRVVRNTKYTSNALWPAVVAASHGVSITKDDHDTIEQARAVCSMLEREGLGGERKVFPVSTWVKTPVANREISGPTENDL